MLLGGESGRLRLRPVATLRFDPGLDLLTHLVGANPLGNEGTQTIREGDEELAHVGVLGNAGLQISGEGTLVRLETAEEGVPAHFSVEVEDEVVEQELDKLVHVRSPGPSESGTRILTGLARSSRIFC